MGRVEMSSSASVFSLYRNLLRQGRSFNSYQFSHYVIRRTKDEFRRHAGESDPMVIKELEEGRARLGRCPPSVADQPAVSAEEKRVGGVNAFGEARIIILISFVVSLAHPISIFKRCVGTGECTPLGARSSPQLDYRQSIDH